MLSDWKPGIIVRISEKGDLSDCANWRGITLLSVTGEIMSNIINNRLKDATFSVLCEEHAGFREERGCADQFFLLRHTIEQCKKSRKSLVLNFVDFRKEFDCMQRPTMWKVFKHVSTRPHAKTVKHV